MTRRLARGQSLVEFALLSPIIFFAVFGLFDLGDAVYTYSTLTQGTQDAAAFASVHCAYAGSGYTGAELAQQVLDSGALLQSDQLTVEGNPADGRACTDPGTAIIVSSSYIYRPVTPLLHDFFPQGGLSLTARAQVLAQ